MHNVHNMPGKTHSSLYDEISCIVFKSQILPSFCRGCSSVSMGDRASKPRTFVNVYRYTYLHHRLSTCNISEFVEGDAVSENSFQGYLLPIRKAFGVDGGEHV